MKFTSRFSLAVGLLASLASALPAQPKAAVKPLHPSLPQVAVPGALGVNIHFTDARPGEMKMLAEGGFHIARMDFAWSAIEKNKGQYDFSAYDRLLQQLENFEIQPLFILDYSNGLYDEGLSPYTDTGREAFAKWAGAAANHFKGHKILWEMYNEPNGFWKPKADVEAYIKLALATGKAIKAAAPGECYIGPAISWFDFSYFEPCFKAGLLNYWDAVSVHPYRGGEPETASVEFRRLRLMIERYKPKGKTIPILSGEWGYSTKGMSETQQAQYLARQWMTNLMNGVPVSIWYDWHNDGTDPNENEHNFGTTRFEYHEGREPVYDPKPSYIAAKNFTQFFNGQAFNKRLILAAPNDYLLIFGKGPDAKMAAWTTGPEHEITIPSSAGPFEITDYLGNQLPQQSADAAGLKLRVSVSPLYLRPIGENKLLQAVADWKSMPLEREATAPATFSLDSSQPKGTLRRDSPPVSERHNLTVDGQTATQITQVVVANPLKLSIEPTLNGKLLLKAENPNGVPFLGTFSFGPSVVNVAEFKAGELEKTLSFPRRSPSKFGKWAVTAHFQGHEKMDTVDLKVRFEAVSIFDSISTANPATALAANSDGDPKIASQQTLSIAPQKTPDWGPVVALKYRMAPGWKFINLQPRSAALTKIDGQPTSLGLWIYGDGSGNIVRMRYSDSNGQTFQPDGIALDWKGWKYVSFPIDGSGGHWNGDNDGIIHGAIKLESLLLLDSAQQKGSEGEIFFSSPSWVYVSGERTR